MKTFHFNYTVTPSVLYDKEGNEKSADFWIDIRNQHSEIQAENLKEACRAFSEILSRNWCIDLTKNGIKTAPEEPFGGGCAFIFPDSSRRALRQSGYPGGIHRRPGAADSLRRTSA